MTALTLADGRAVAGYDDGSQIEPVDSPRPYLHPLTTLGGVPMTEVRAADHRHHFGVSMAVPDVDGTSHWGGRTYVRDVGSTLLDNHGAQRRLSIDAAPGVIGEQIEWTAADGSPQLSETRILRALQTGSGWVLDWTSRLRAVGDVSIGSPATNGRDGAHYGGIFWRTPFRFATVRVSSGSGEAVAHGSTSPWLAVSTPRGSLVARGTGRPWFVRAEEYVGFGPALARDERLVIADGDVLEERLSVLVTDLPDLDDSAARALAAEIESVIDR